MAVERDININNQKEVVEHFYSPVVEGIALLSLLLDESQHEFAAPDRAQLIKELSSDSINFVEQWNKTTDLDFSILFNFLLPCPYFYDVDLFNEKVANLKHEEYLYHLFGEEVPIAQLKALVAVPSDLNTYEDNILWDSEEKRLFIKEFITNLSLYRERISKLFLEVVNSRVLNQRIGKSKEQIEQAIHDLKSLTMEPLALAQYVMGKTFRRTSLYKMYYFMPSYYFTPHRIRVFDSKICMVIFGVAAPLSDAREESANLESQLKAISDRNRLLILRMLTSKKEYGAKIAEYLGITTATVSHHLEILKKAGFVSEEKIGTIKYFKYEEEHAKAILEDIKKFLLP